MQKGISPLIAAVVLIAFTIAIAFIVATWGTSFVQSQTEQISSQMDCMGALGIGSPQFYLNTENNVSKLGISVTNLNRKIELRNIKVSVYYSMPSKNLENLDSGITLAPGDTKTIVINLTEKEKPESVRVVASNCPNAPKLSSAVAFSLGGAPTTSVTTTSTSGTSTMSTTTTTTNGTTTTTNATTTTASTTTTTTILDLHEEHIIFHASFGVSSSDDSLYDYSGNGHNMTIHGNPQWVTHGVVGGAYDFDGVNDYLYTSNAPDLNFGSKDFTISAWFRPEGAHPEGRGTIIAKYKARGSNRQYRLWHSPTGNISWWTSSGGYYGYVTITTPHSFADNVWHHAVVVRHGLNTTIYVNGAKEIEKAAGNITSRSYNTFKIGSEDDVSWKVYYEFNGKIDEVVIWDIPLSEQEIQYLYNIQK